MRFEVIHRAGVDEFHLEVQQQFFSGFIGTVYGQDG
jgi:hypothetical protein